MHTLQWLSLLLVTNFSIIAHISAQESGEILVKKGDISEDIYLAGAQVNIDANVQGDIVVAGGRVVIEGKVNDDVIAAGGNISVDANINDDARLAGGQIVVSGYIAGDIIAAGGNLNLTSDSVIGNRAWLSGGNVEINGRIDKELKVSGGRVVIAGEVLGDVSLYAKRIDILPGTIITGDLKYKSAQKANIHNDAVIKGEIEQLPLTEWQSSKLENWKSIGLVFLIVVPLSIFLTAVVLYLLMPTTFTSISMVVQTRFLQSMAVGLIAFLVIPIISILLAITIIGLPLALLVLLVYLFLIIFGYFSGVFYISDKLLGRLRKNKEQTKIWRLFSIFIALLIMLILTFIPLVGGLIIYFIFLIGIGGASFYILNKLGYMESSQF